MYVQLQYAGDMSNLQLAVIWIQVFRGKADHHSKFEQQMAHYWLFGGADKTGKSHCRVQMGVGTCAQMDLP